MSEPTQENPEQTANQEENVPADPDKPPETTPAEQVPEPTPTPAPASEEAATKPEEPKTETEAKPDAAEKPKVPSEEPTAEKHEIHEESMISEVVVEAVPEDKRRRSSTASGKRKSGSSTVSTDKKRTSGSVNQETFMAPDMMMMRASIGSEKRGSQARRVSLPEGKKLGMLGSKAKMVLGSILDIRSNVAEAYDKKVAKFQNTYKLESDNPFNSEKVYVILKEVMDEILENLQYDPDKCASTAKVASNQIRSKVKQLEFDRYKLVCLVSIGEKNFQDVFNTCRFLWDPEKDGYSFYTLENTYVYAIAYCFGLYYE